MIGGALSYVWETPAPSQEFPHYFAWRGGLE